MLRGFQSLLIIFLLLGTTLVGVEKPLNPIEYARGAGRWILSLAKNQDGALTWSVNDTNKKEPGFNLYSGMPGGILLLAELAKEDPSGPFANAVATSVAGLESLRITVGDQKVWGIQKGESITTSAGLYTGEAGIAWLYLELHRLTGENRYLARALSITDSILTRAQVHDSQAAWEDSTDIISGAAGTGLYLLRAARDLKDPRCKDMAAKAGNYLMAQGVQTPVGLKWKINSATPKLYPNFSHGTSGVSYFLVRLAEATGQKRFFNAALRGAREMQTIAAIEGNGCTWYHHEGDGENLWYVSWCHGPAGTARLFYEMAQATKDQRWMEWVTRSATWLLASGIPDPPKPINGYWNESVCCGTAGIGEFFTDLYLATGKKEYLKTAEYMAAHLAKMAQPTGTGFRWVQAEHRVSPNERDAQTGYAQGAAGFGLFFLKLSRAQRSVPIGWKLPDNPF